MFLWIFSNSCPRNLLLVRSHQAEIIIIKRLIQERNNVIMVRVELRSFDQGRRKNDVFTLSATAVSVQFRAVMMELLQPLEWIRSSQLAVLRVVMRIDSSKHRCPALLFLDLTW